MLTLTINGDPRTLPSPLTVAQLLHHLGHESRKVAVEVNHEVVPARQHAEHTLESGDRVEIVTLVGGGSPDEPLDTPLVVGQFTFTSRLITGTGKYSTYDLMRDCLAASG